MHAMRILDQLKRLEQGRKRWATHMYYKVILVIVLVGTGNLLLRVSGGFPPTAWVFLFHVIPAVPHLWFLRGPALLLPLIGLGTLSGTLALSWLMLMRIGWSILQLSKQR